MKKIKIEWLTDDHWCDTCGTSYADGAKVTIDGEEVLNLVPVASCFSSLNYDRDEVYRRIFNDLGYTVEET